MKTLDKIGIAVFAILAISAAIGSFKNITLIALAAMCIIMVVVFYCDLKKENK